MITFFTDPHLGRSAKAHTTPVSRTKLDLTLYCQANYSCRENTVCLGDLFHRSHNDENVIKRGAEIVERCDYVLAGNHDLPNRVGGNSSLELIASIGNLDQKIISAPISESRVFNTEIDGASLTLIPHHTSQELFDNALEQADGGDILCLHCNVNNGFVVENNAALNITTEQLEKLLDVYKYILIGHEHNYKEMFDGRVKILGNTHPTSFSDVSNKYIHHYDPKSDTWEQEEIWSADVSSIKIDFKSLYTTDLTDFSFIEIVGTLESLEHTKEVTEAIRRLWANSPELLMLRNNTELKALETTKIVTSDFDIENLVTVIDVMVKDSPLENVWNKYKEAHDA